MGLTYYDDFRKPRTTLANGLIVLNGVFSFCMAFYWSGLAWFLDEPVRWAMRGGVGINPSWTEYPYVVLWLVPMMCMFFGWVAIKAGQDSIARIVGSYPLLFTGLVIGWYYLAPMHWH